MPPRPTPLLPALRHHHPAYTIPHLHLHPHPRPHPHRHRHPCQTSQRTFTCTAHLDLGRKSKDHYATLGVSRGASSKEIKASFYQLSKKYHPDLNRLDEEAKRKFQEVSEAWGVLGSERGRREYDRQLRTASSSYSSATSPGGPHQNYTYDPGENAARRARASYAWEYQRRRGDSSRASASAGASGGATGGSRSRSHTGFYSGTDDQERINRAAHARARGAFGSGHGMGEGDYSASGARSSGDSLFERYAARQRRREEFVSSRSTSSSSSSSSSASPSSHPYSGASGNPNDPFSPRVHDQEDSPGASPLLRFAQVIGTLTFIFVITGSLGLSGGGNGRLRAEGSEKKMEQDQRDWKEQ